MTFPTAGKDFNQEKFEAFNVLDETIAHSIDVGSIYSDNADETDTFSHVVAVDEEDCSASTTARLNDAGVVYHLTCTIVQRFGGTFRGVMVHTGPPVEVREVNHKF